MGLNSRESRIILPYQRQDAVNYAHLWAFDRNPRFYNFEKLGGDCTNFASQVLLAGSKVMNLTPIFGWYYFHLNSRTPSWTGVNFLYEFLINNHGDGPFAEEVDETEVEPGDLVQLAFKKESTFNHTPVIVSSGMPAKIENIKVAAHTEDKDEYPLTEYDWINIRFLHILGVRRHGGNEKK